MADENDIKNRKPNTLERIGGDVDLTRTYKREYAQTRERAGFETKELREIRRKMQERRDAADQIAQVVWSHDLQSREDYLRTIRRMTSKSDFEKLDLEGRSPQYLQSKAREVYGTYEAQSAFASGLLLQKEEHLIGSRRADAQRLLQQTAMSSVRASASGRRGLMREEGVRELASEYVGVASIADLRKGQERASSGVYRRGEELIESTKNIFDPGGKESYIKAGESYEAARRKSAAIELAIKMKEGQQHEDERLYASSESLVERIGSKRLRGEIKDRAISGGYGSPSDIREKLAQKEKEFIEAITKFSQELKSIGEVSSDTREKLRSAKDSLEEYSEAHKSAKKESFDRMQRGIDIARVGIGLASYGFVGADAEQMQLRTQAAAMTNAKFSDMYAATKGDMASLRRITQSQFEKSAEFGTTYANRALTLSAADMTLSATQGFLDARMMNASGAVNAVGDVAKSGIRIGKGITEAETQLSFAQQRRTLIDEVNKVPDAARQAYFDFMMGTAGNLIGAGSGARMSNLYQAATSTGLGDRLASLGVSPKDIGDIFGAGTAMIGPSFSGNAARAGQIVTRAAEFQRSGIMGAQQYMQSIGQLTAVGGSEKTMEDILASAVARGVGDAKSLKGIVDLTQMLSRDSASRGIGAATQIEKTVSAGLDLFKNVSTDESLKQNLVGDILQKAINREKQSGVNIQNLAAIERLKARGVKPLAAGEIVTTPIDELRARQEKFYSKYGEGDKVPTEELLALGTFGQMVIDPRTGKVRKQSESKAMISDVELYKSYNIGPGSPGIKQIEEFAGQIERGEEIDPVKLYKSGMDVAGIASLIAIRTKAAKDKEREKVDLSTGAGMPWDAAQAIKSIGAKTDFNMITAGAAGGLGAIQAEMTNIKIDPNKAGAEAASAAEKMTLDTKSFDQSVSTFSDAVKKFEAAIRPTPMISDNRGIPTDTSKVADVFKSFSTEQRTDILRFLTKG